MVNDKKKLAIVLLNWNGEKWLQKFLPNIIKHSDDHDIIIADNNSSDNSIHLLKTNFPSIIIIKNKENGGFAKGYNDALKIIEGNYTYYLLINTDVEVTANWITPLLNKIESSKNIAGVQPKILSYNNPTEFEHAGACGGFMDINYYPFCRGRIFDNTEKDQQQYDNEKEIFWTTGACMIVCASTFHQLGGFDQDFFAHMEEIDFCWRAKLKGKQFFVVPSSTVYHVGGATLNYKNPRKTYLNFRNNLFMIHKNHIGRLFPKIICRLLLDGIAGIVFLLKFELKNFLAVLKAHYSYYTQLKKLNKKRKLIQLQKENINLTGVYRATILYSYFFKGIKRFSELNKRYFG